MVTRTENRIDAAPVSPTVSPETMPGKYQEIPLSLIDPHPDNPRGNWEGQEIDRLVPSIQELGVVQAIVVRPRKGRYQLVAGERRFRAARSVGLKAIPALVKQLTDAEALLQMTVENLQRKNLNPIEKAKALVKLCDPVDKGGAGKSRIEAAALFGKSRPWASNLIRLLELPAAWQKKVARGELQERAARHLTDFTEKPEVLKAIETDMQANPWAWRTTQDFERSLSIIVANPAAGGKQTAKPSKPRAPRAPVTTVRPEPAAKAADEKPVASCSIGLEEVCAAIAEVNSLEELDIVQLAIDCRLEALKIRDRARGTEIVSPETM